MPTVRFPISNFQIGRFQKMHDEAYPPQVNTVEVSGIKTIRINGSMEKFQKKKIKPLSEYLPKNIFKPR